VSWNIPFRVVFEETSIHSSLQHMQVLTRRLYCAVEAIHSIPFAEIDGKQVFNYPEDATSVQRVFFLNWTFCFSFNLIATFIADDKIDRFSFSITDIHNNVSPLAPIKFSFQPFILELKELSLLKISAT
jgi:hypothetical protein